MGGQDFPAFFISGIMPEQQFDPDLDDIFPQSFRSYFLI